MRPSPEKVGTPHATSYPYHPNGRLGISISTTFS
ncbi:hypothetical protein M7I_0275 [Glarea lozoyensis 74030]|uniref:Uncharacterized protein n=1 Tax=Glarea lozoyensis (strain ATCC 74030 / MF5533) TaxID=1104152 RepID=H0ECX8_GLAL7|nr:hypothetical protein M7I_0275 [Glarea lozoyensis 74030]